MILFWLGLACAPKEIPPHLRVETTQDVAPEAAPTTDAEALTVLLRRDPLGRLADPKAPGAWSGLPSAGALEDWASLARAEATNPHDWQALEQRHPGSIIVGLARGGELGRLEGVLAGSGSQTIGVDALGWLGPIRIGEQLYPREPGAWLSSEPAGEREAALAIMERRVMLGWLASPSIPLEAVAGALDPAVHGRLLDAPAGALIAARARGSRDETRAAEGRAFLEQATSLALEEAAADADGEQERWRSRLAEAREAHGTQDPIGALLARARDALVTDAADDASAGLYLVAATAERLRGSCPDAPCGGLDRTTTLSNTASWGEDVVGPARTWMLIAAKTSVDAFEASWDHPSFKTHAPLLADVLLGSGAASVDQVVLRVPVATPATFLALGRAAGRDGVTDLKGARRVLRSHLAGIAEEALAAELPQDQRAITERVLRRAQKAP